MAEGRSAIRWSQFGPGDAVLAMAFLSAGAGVIHTVVAPRHFQEWWLFGTFFVVSAVAQTAWSIAVLKRPNRWLVGAAVVGNLAVVCIWLLSRTAGLPIGPNAGRAEPVGVLDVIAGVYEFALAAFGLFALRNRIEEVPIYEGLERGGVIAVVGLVVVGTSLAIFGGAGH